MIDQWIWGTPFFRQTQIDSMQTVLFICYRYIIYCMIYIYILYVRRLSEFHVQLGPLKMLPATSASYTDTHTIKGIPSKSQASQEFVLPAELTMAEPGKVQALFIASNRQGPGLRHWLVSSNVG